MLRIVFLVLGILVRMLGSRRDLALENLALGQQLAVYKARNRRPRINAADVRFGSCCTGSGSVGATRW